MALPVADGSRSRSAPTVSRVHPMPPFLSAADRRDIEEPPSSAVPVATPVRMDGCARQCEKDGLASYSHTTRVRLKHTAPPTWNQARNWPRCLALQALRCDIYALLLFRSSLPRSPWCIASCQPQIDLDLFAPAEHPRGWDGDRLFCRPLFSVPDSSAMQETENWNDAPSVPVRYLLNASRPTCSHRKRPLWGPRRRASPTTTPGESYHVSHSTVQ